MGTDESKRVSEYKLVFVGSVSKLVICYGGMSVIQTSAIEHVGQLNDLPIYCFLINAHILWCQLHEKTALHVYLALLNRWWFGFSSFAVLSSSLHLWPCLCCVWMSSVTPQKRKCCVLSIQQKLEICDHSRNGWSYSWISAEYGIGKLTVFDVHLGLAKLQTYRIFRVTDRVQSRHVRITDIPLNCISKHLIREVLHNHYMHTSVELD